MCLTSCSLRGWLTSAVLLIAASVAGAQAPAPAARPVPPKGDLPADYAKRQVLTRQIGFEAHQQGYLAKVQGAASQKVLWVKTPPPKSNQPSSLSALFSGLFGP